MKNIKDFLEDSRVKAFGSDLSSDVSHIYPFDCPPIDIAFGGGVPSGKIIEIYGWESSGKSTFSLDITKAFAEYWKSQREDNYGVGWIECESALDQVRARYMGCPTNAFLISEAETCEDAWEIMTALLEKAVKNKMRLILVWDTLAAAPTRAELEGGVNSNGLTEKPRLLRRMFRHLTPLLGKTDSTLILVNQMGKSLNMYQPDESPGGGGPKFHSSIRIHIKAGKSEVIVLPNGKEHTVAMRSELFFKKNKITLPKQRIEIIIQGESGLDKFATVLNYLEDNKLIPLKGGWKYIEIPVVFGTKDRDPEFEEVKFQNPKQLLEKIETKYTQGKDWMDYLCYRYATTMSPLLKVKIIEKVWAYENKFFGKPITVLNEKEKDAAMLQQLLNQEDDEDEKA